METEERDKAILVELSERAKEIKEQIKELKDRNEELEERKGKIENNDLEEEYDNMLDDVNTEVRIGNMTYSPSRVLKEIDEVAYNCGYTEYFDEELSEIEEEQESIKDEITKLEEELNDLLRGN